MSVGSLASALKSPGPCGYDLTLKLSYVPRASRVGVTPCGGEAPATATSAASTSSAVPAARAVRYTRRFIVPLPIRVEQFPADLRPLASRVVVLVEEEENGHRTCRTAPCEPSPLGQGEPADEPVAVSRTVDQ